MNERIERIKKAFKPVILRQADRTVVTKPVQNEYFYPVSLIAERSRDQSFIEKHFDRIRSNRVNKVR